MNRTAHTAFFAISCFASVAHAQLLNEPPQIDETVEHGTPEYRSTFPSYDASLGTLPAQQGWTESNFNGDDQIIGQLFHLNASGSSAAAQVNSVGFDWSLGFRYSMTTRVPVGTVAVTFLGPGYRGGADLAARDAVGRQYGVLVGASSLVFSSQSNFSPDPLLTVSMPFDGASEFHTYTIVSDTDGATLEIDGIPRLHVPEGDLQAPGSPYIQWSIDGRANAVESEWASVVFGTAAGMPCTADLNNDGVLDIFDVFEYLADFNAGCP
ncbi:MAG: hypothetical protein KC996_04810 [Phycisphaerales bacterium]|nr:hypothetical protein [Phycisphaerales bacterium]